MTRFICYFLIAWLSLLSGSVYAHASADAAHEVSHVMAHAEEDRSTGLDAVADPAIGQATEAADLAHEREHAEACGLNHCGHGHATDVLAALRTRLDAGGDGAPLPTPQAWASQALPNNIERPKWDHTTPTVVNL